MSGYSDDIESYIWMCEHFEEEVQYKMYGNNKVPDVYGEHAQGLWERLTKMRFEAAKDEAQNKD